jgi:hypothetical protein
MRPLAPLVAALALSLAGCDLISGINDELKAGERELERYGGPAGRKTPEPAAPTQAPASSSATSEAVRRAAERWWSSARSLVPSEKDPTVIRCELGSGVQFMREADCEMRGGRVSRG